MNNKRDWSKFLEVVSSGQYVILDTETTGLRRPAEIVQLAIIDGKDGATLLDTLVKPVGDIPGVATAIHGIDKLKVIGAPTWNMVRAHMLRIIEGRNVVIYNAVYDRHMMHCSDEAIGLPSFDYKEKSTFYCAMEWYADLWGLWDSYHGSYTWQKLSSACSQQGLMLDMFHEALVDCQATYRLIRKVLEGKPNHA